MLLILAMELWEYWLASRIEMSFSGIVKLSIDSYICGDLQSSSVMIV